MARPLRIYLIACTVLAYAYLLWHAREPLRFNIGDPWSDANVLSSINYVKQYGFLETSFTDILDVGPLTVDSYRYIHYPPLSEIIYGAIGKYLGVSDIGTFRLFGLAFSIASMFLLFQYVRRMYSDRIALIATMLFATSLIWLMYADSMHQAPVMQASGFLALWGLVRAIETRLRRHYAAAIIGSFACFLTSYDYWLFLPAAVLFTVYFKLGNPFARGHRHFIVLCAAGCLLGIVAKCAAVIGAVGWHEFVADIHLQFFERATSRYDRGFTSAVPTMLRRITLVFTPFVWISIGVHAWRALRAPSLADAIKLNATWMLLTALVFFNVFSQLAASQLLPSQVLLPFYTIGSALLIDQLLEGSRWRRIAAYVWLVIAPAWGFGFMLSHPRSLFDRADIAKVNSYLAANDRNDFMMSNLMSIGHIQAAFERHYWSTPAPKNPPDAILDMLYTYEITGTDYAHAAVFTDPDSRFIDKSLWGLAMPRRQWSVTGWPYLHRTKANKMIREVDANVMRALGALEAQRVLRLGNFDLYRTDRAKAIEIAGRRVPSATHIDFGSLTAARHQLIGWGATHLVEPEGIAATPITGYEICAAPASAHEVTRRNLCKTVLTKVGLEVKHSYLAARAMLLVRLERACDAQIHIALARPAVLALTLNGVASPPALLGRTATFDVTVRAGINEISLESVVPQLTAEVQSLDVECR